MGVRGWEWVATAYLVGLPCLWWRGLPQDHALAVAYPMATVALAGWSVGVAHRRVSSRVIGWLMLGVVASALWTMPDAGFPALILHAVVAFVAWWALVSAAPSAAWLERRLVWLAVANAVYAWGQWAGIDPLFEVVDSSHTDPIRPLGWFSHRSQLAVLWLVACPLARRWQRGLLVASAAMTGSWTATGGMLLWWLSRRCRPWVVLGAAGGVLLGCWGGSATSRLLPRVTSWSMALGQALWSPLAGYGLGAWETQPVGPFYNSYVAAFHIGGGLLLAPLLWAVWRVWRSRPSPVRDALLALAAAACVQTPWHFIRVVIVTVALGAAWELRRQDADQPMDRGVAPIPG